MHCTLLVNRTVILSVAAYIFLYCICCCIDAYFFKTAHVKLNSVGNVTVNLVPVDLSGVSGSLEDDRVGQFVIGRRR